MKTISREIVHTRNQNFHENMKHRSIRERNENKSYASWVNNLFSSYTGNTRWNAIYNFLFVLTSHFTDYQQIFETRSTIFLACA